VDITNLNRQIHALHSTVGRMKAEVMAERIYAINPDAVVDVVSEMVTPERLEDFFQSDYDFVVDAIDMVSAKLAIIEKCTREGIPIISSMGTGNKLDPTQLTLTDIYKTSVCPLARVMRHELKKRGVRALQVVYSPECPLTPVYSEETVKALENTRKKPPGSTGFVPSAAGLILASAVVRTLLTKTA
jgi:tRNA A37 threonylcarbamoyladenosine dehydratase